MEPTGRYSVAHYRDHWYVVCRSQALKDKPLAKTLMGTPLVLFRQQDGTPSALLDRCAHRNVPLSLGYVEHNRLVCGYHGWEYDGDGLCQRVPALCGVQTGKARRVQHFPTREHHGFVWVYGNADTPPKVEPFRFPEFDNPAYSSVVHHAQIGATLHATLENILDVPHTAFLHRGLFRGVKRNKIKAVIRKASDRVEAEFIGEPVPTGVLGRLLAPQGGTIMHFDRFILPSIAQVEYRLGQKNRILVSSALTPIDDFQTELHAVITFKTIFPPALLRSTITPIAKKVLDQDKKMLERQTYAIQHFGGEQYASTDVDLLGPHIWRLLRHAERGETPKVTPEETIELLA